MRGGRARKRYSEKDNQLDNDGRAWANEGTRLQGKDLLCFIFKQSASVIERVTGGSLYEAGAVEAAALLAREGVGFVRALFAWAPRRSWP